MPSYNLPASSEFFKGDIYDRMAEDLHLAGFSQRTVHGYLRSVRQLADYCRCSPEHVSEQQVRKWLLHLKLEKEFAYGSLRVAFSGVKFFFTRTCPRRWEVLTKTKLQNVKSLPEVLTRKQVQQIIDACNSLRMATFFWTVYSLGLRLDEARNLQVGDVDSHRMMVHIHRGKGAKDRYVPLPESTVARLRDYWTTHRNASLLFPAESRNHQEAQSATTPMSISSAQGAIKRITRQLNFGKKVSTHTLRHCYATHLLEAGLSIKLVQKYLGHSSLQTTLCYLHLTDSQQADARRVLNRLFQQPSLTDRFQR